MLVKAFLVSEKFEPHAQQWIWVIMLPFSDTGILYRNNLVNNISEEPFWLGSPGIWHISTDQGVDELINFRTYSVNFWLSYSPFSDTGILYRNNLVNKISEELLWLGSWYMAYKYRPRCR